jgi:hypothetical protein
LVQVESLGPLEPQQGPQLVVKTQVLFDLLEFQRWYPLPFEGTQIIFACRFYLSNSVLLQYRSVETDIEFRETKSFLQSHYRGVQAHFLPNIRTGGQSDSFEFQNGKFLAGKINQSKMSTWQNWFHRV